jgi:hypothetical protein
MTASEIQNLQGVGQAQRRILYAHLKAGVSERQKRWEYTNDAGERELNLRCTAAKVAAQKAQEV